MTHRGNPREHVFSTAEHRDVDCALLKKYGEYYGLKIWSWCLRSADRRART
ncbi:MAG: hypothetical protein ACR2IE_03605 [Candidatus Sumerlaeaceae bacterium]